MWKTWETNGKWIGCGRDNKIYECGDDGAGTQIGTLAYKELTIEPGETLKLFMTKGMFGDAKWEGEVGDTLYREEKDGQGKPIAKLEYRPVKLEDGSEAVLLMSRPMSDGAWVGVRDGKVIESNSK